MTGNCVCFYSIVGVPVSQCLQGLLKPLSLEVTAIRRSSRGLKSNPCRGFSLVERIKHWLLIGWDVYSQKKRVIRHSSTRWNPILVEGSPIMRTPLENLSLFADLGLDAVPTLPSSVDSSVFGDVICGLWHQEWSFIARRLKKLKSWSHIYRAQQQHCLVNLVSTLSWTASWSHYSRIGRRQC